MITVTETVLLRKDWLKESSPLRDEFLRFGPVLWVIVKETCRDFQRCSFRQKLAIHYSILVNISCKPVMKHTKT